MQQKMPRVMVGLVEELMGVTAVVMDQMGLVTIGGVEEKGKEQLQEHLLNLKAHYMLVVVVGLKIILTQVLGLAVQEEEEMVIGLMETILVVGVKQTLVEALAAEGNIVHGAIVMHMLGEVLE